MEASALRLEREFGGDRRKLRWTAALAALLTVVFTSSYWLTPSGIQAQESLLIGTLVLGAGAALLALRRSPDSTRLLWWIVFSVFLLWIAGECGRLIVRHYNEGASEQWLPSGAVALVAYSLLLIAAMRELAGSSALAWSLGLLDAAIVAVAFCAPWLDLLVLPRIGDAGGRVLLPQLLAPVLAVAVVAASALVVQTARTLSVWAYVLTAALVAGLVGDLLFVRQLLGDGGGGALAGWEARALLILAATALVGRLARPRELHRSGSGIARLTVVIVAYTAALVFAAYAFERGNQLAGFTVASTISALLLLRLLISAVDRYRHSERLEQALREQEQLAVMDSLTGLYNRRFLDAELKLELDRGARSQQPVGILLCDLDHFKQVNDRYGHLVGDSVLREVARRLLGAVRNGDLVARYGGEEFVVLLPGGGKEQLKEIGERCRRAFEEAPFFLPKGRKATVTISIGGACWPEDASGAQPLFEVADSALYRAKEQGRNRIFISEPESVREVPALAAESQSELVNDVTTRSPGTSAQRAQVENGEMMERWAALVARALGLDEQTQRRCALATRFHDVGKNALPESILVKNGPLSVAEWELVCEHPERGATLVELAPSLSCVGSIIREHHERFDGRGYPLGKSRDEISPEARIVACCDAWSAMRSDRPYAPAKTVGEARAEMLAGRGTQFDPDVVMAFLMLDEISLDETEGATATLL